MSFLSRLFDRSAPQPVQDQAVLIYLDGQGLPDEVYTDCDLMTLEEKLEYELGSGKLGVVDGNEVGPREITIFLYGADAEAMVRGIEPILREYPLCNGARVVVRRGAPGAELREFLVEA
ncbi:hypothetical protein [Chromobacterium alticapitis]|uniref:DUF695 domain-containing protein n=1 Tax=Chromobacterium alticapitis TaxID=2073169 RepID=A0A2S5DEE0_9NEIS|nr:hypothetical protein [Chromobacterium alticapitis]POZ61342.1 hypothetical protein C2I19_14115 [Chromobacterium alticapitis]